MRILLTWLLIVALNATTWAEDAEPPTGMQLSFDDEIAELERLTENAELRDVINFLDAHGLDMISRAKPEKASQLVFAVTDAIRRGDNVDPEWARDPVTKAWWHAFFLKFGQIYTGRFSGSPLSVITNEADHAFVPEDYRDFPAFALMQARALNKNVMDWTYNELNQMADDLDRRADALGRGDGTKESSDAAATGFLAHYALPTQILLTSNKKRDKASLERLFCSGGGPRFLLLSNIGRIGEFDGQRLMERLARYEGYPENERQTVIAALARAHAVEVDPSRSTMFLDLLEKFIKREVMVDKSTPSYLLPPVCE